jgi:hypothetical protein
MRHQVGFLLFLIVSVGSAVRAQNPALQRNGFFIAIGYARLQTPDHAYIYGVTNLPPHSVLYVSCSDFIGQGSQVVSQKLKAVVGEDGLFQASLAPKQNVAFKRNMICDVSFHAWDQPAEVLKITGQHGEKLGNPVTNSQVGIFSSGRYLQAETVLHD